MMLSDPRASLILYPVLDLCFPSEKITLWSSRIFRYLLQLASGISAVEAIVLTVKIGFWKIASISFFTLLLLINSCAVSRSWSYNLLTSLIKRIFLSAWFMLASKKN